MNRCYEEFLLNQLKEIEEEYEYRKFCENPPDNLDILIKERLEKIKKHNTNNK